MSAFDMAPVKLIAAHLHRLQRVQIIVYRGSHSRVAVLVLLHGAFN